MKIWLRRTPFRHAWRAAYGLALVAALATACGGEPKEPLPGPAKESLALTAEEEKSYAPLTIDKLVNALEVAGDDDDAREQIIEKVHRKVVGWTAVVRTAGLIKKGLEVSEFAVVVAPRSAGLFPATVRILFEGPNDSPIAELDRGTVITFVGRLEFDGRSRKPWVLDSRMIAGVP